MGSSDVANNTGPVVVQAPAKVTLSLRVTGVRPDGLHTIDAEMITVDLFDTLLITEGDAGLSIKGAGPDVIDSPDNLVNRALDFVGRRAHVELTKRIPTKAGLGGGSADAGAVLRWAGHSKLAEAAELGADVPFCARGGRARVTGIGEKIEALPFKDITLTLVTPPIDCPTPAVYQMWDQLGGPKGPNLNDLEQAALAVSPELGEVRDALAQSTGQQPHLAGSGSTWFVYGSFPGEGRNVVRSVDVETQLLA